MADGDCAVAVVLSVRRLHHLARTFTPLARLSCTRLLSRSTMASAAAAPSSSPSAASLLSLLRSAPHTQTRKNHPAYPPRFAVPDDKLAWDVPWPEYQPPEFTSEGAMKRSAERPTASQRRSTRVLSVN